MMEILTDPVTLDPVERQSIMQIAYGAADGSPRAVPVGCLLRWAKFVFSTIPSSDKVAALLGDPPIVITTDDYPAPSCL
jgi:nitroimidazol reductase NimA-like FMN-containing flavoprotein (pyridoxamine 5'-phosphate oxidase superfamily)